MSPPRIHLILLPSPSFHLTSLELNNAPIEDDELVCLANVPLTLDGISHLTNAGLGTALTSVYTLLTHLYISVDGLPHNSGEQLALNMAHSLGSFGELPRGSHLFFRICSSAANSSLHLIPPTGAWRPPSGETLRLRWSLNSTCSTPRVSYLHNQAVTDGLDNRFIKIDSNQG